MQENMEKSNSILPNNCFRVDLSNIKNYREGVKLIQLFKPSDGVYLQYFKNNLSTYILWNHKVSFQYTNMKIHGSRKKNVKNETRSRKGKSENEVKDEYTNV